MNADQKATIQGAATARTLTPALMFRSIVAIDPGTRQSGFVIYRAGHHEITHRGIVPNEDLLRVLSEECAVGSFVVLEWVESFGMPVGRDVFETVYWIGRFAQAAEQIGHEVHRIARRTVKLHLCDTSRAKDANVNQAVRDKVAEWHGIPERKLKGRKAEPGPLYGFKSHIWSALALAITWAETRAPAS